ncbi:MAG: 6-hydroxymethylpterin diphosphokinase MptE-like protein, partial [Spirochaetota bacterium]
PWRSMPVLVADPAIYPTVLNNYPGPMVLSSSVFDLGKTIEKFSGTKGTMAAGGSVSTTAFDLARIMASDPIILTGLDLCYREGKTHLSGSFIENYALSTSTKFNPVQNFYSNIVKKSSPLVLKNNQGENVYTDNRMIMYRHWLEQQFAAGSCRVINCTERGLEIQGAEYIPLPRLQSSLKLSTRKRKKALKEKIISLVGEPERDKKSLKNLTGIKKDPATNEPRTREVSSSFVNYLQYLEQMNTGFLMIKRCCEKARRFSEMLQLANNPSHPVHVHRQLDLLDQKIISFKDELTLLNMVMQTPLNDILNSSGARDQDSIQNSIKLYTSLEHACDFISGLLEKVIRKADIKGLQHPT